VGTNFLYKTVARKMRGYHMKFMTVYHVD